MTRNNPLLGIYRVYNQSVEFIFPEETSEADRLRKVADFIEVSDGQVTYKFKKGGRTILTAWMPSAFEEVYEKVRAEHGQGNLELVFPKPDNTCIFRLNLQGVPVKTCQKC